MGQKGGGTGRVGLGSGYSRGPKDRGGPLGVGRKIRGGGVRAVMKRFAENKKFSLAHVTRHSGLSPEETLAEVDALVASGEIQLTYFSQQVAQILEQAGRPAPMRNGRAVRGFTTEMA